MSSLLQNSGLNRRKTPSLLRYDLKQIPYDYTVEVINRFQGLDLIDRVPEELWTEVRNIVQEVVTRTIPKKKKCKKERQNDCLRRPYRQLRKEEKQKGKGERKKQTQLNAEFQRIARRDKKAFLSEQNKEIEEKNRMGKTRDLFKKIRDTKGIFHAKMGSVKERRGMDLTEAEGKEERERYTHLSAEF